MPANMEAAIGLSNLGKKDGPENSMIREAIFAEFYFAGISRSKNSAVAV